MTLKYHKAALRVIYLPYSTGGTRILFFFRGESPLTLRPNFNCKKGNVTAGGGSPLTLRPNFNCEKGNVTAAAAACMPRRGIFVDENLWEYIAHVLNLSCNLRVIFDLVVQGKRELFSFFASFFLFSKEKKKRNSL